MKIVYGRSPSLIAKREEQSGKYVESLTGLMLRESQNRPQNEAALRGWY